MRVRVDMKRNQVTTPWGLFRYIDGTLDDATGIVWLDSVQGGPGGRKIPAGAGVHLASGALIMPLPGAQAEDAARLATKLAAADAANAAFKRGPGRPRKEVAV